MTGVQAAKMSAVNAGATKILAEAIAAYSSSPGKWNVLKSHEDWLGWLVACIRHLTGLMHGHGDSDRASR